MHFKNSLNSTRGSAILWALLLSIVLSILAVFINNQGTINSRLAIKMDADKDVANALSQISAALASPLNCTATMYNLLINAPGVVVPLTAGIKICAPGATCSDGLNAINFMTVQTGINWKLNLIDNKTTRARITLLQYKLIYPATMISPTVFRPGMARIYVTFEKILSPKPPNPYEYNTLTTPSDPNNPAIHYFDVYVVTHDWNPVTSAFTARTRFSGCAKSLHTINVY